MEATGGYETVVARALGAAHLPLAVVNPRQIRDFARAPGKLAKTDRLRACPRVGRRPGPWAAAITRFAQAIRPPARPIAGADLLVGVSRIGPATVRTLVAELPEPGRLTRRKIAAPAGFAPINRDSDTLRAQNHGNPLDPPRQSLRMR